MSQNLTPFQQAIVTVVRMIPRGKVMSYGQVAAYIGAPRGARMVGWTLRGLESKTEIPWWRVLNMEGRITIKGNLYNTPSMQKALLESDGVVVSEDFTLDMTKYRLALTREDIKKLELSSEYLIYLEKKGYLVL